MNPARGGLSASVRSLVPALAALGHPSEVVCLDAPQEIFLRPLPFAVHALGPTRLGYGFAPRLLPWLRAHVRQFDAVLVHGLWQYHGLATDRALRPAGSPPGFIFPHGMLDPWFKRQYPLKHVKKSLYWWLFERRILRHAAAVLFTCEEERRLARTSFGGSSYRERVVAFGTAAPPDHPAPQQEAFFQREPALRGRPYWLFLGRLHRKKGVDLLLEAYGDIAARLAVPAGTVFWPGMLEGDAKWGALRAAEVFVLPSHQENFGIAVVESLACRTPVLISDQVNIWREIAGDGVGLVEPDTVAGVVRLLGRWITLDAAAKRAMRAAAAESFQRRYEVGAAARSLVATLQASLPPGLSP